MNTQEKLDQKSDQVESLSRKYGERSISPHQDSQRKNLRRIKNNGQSQKSFNIMKPQQQNFLKSSQETSGGGFYKRSQIMGTSFPTIPTREKQNNDSKYVHGKKEENVSFAQIDSILGMKQLLGPNHHCHFEIQVKHLVAKLEASELLTIKAKDELENVIWMVKNYNSEGLISKLLQLQQLKNELEKDQQLMREEIEMLGVQRDDWQLKYQEIYEKLLKMQGIENDLHDALHKLQMSNESLEQINRRLREKQLEVQDWQRKCNTHDEQFKIRINKLEETLKEKETQIQQLQKKLQRLDSESAFLQQEMKNKSEKLEEEQRRSKQLHAELLDTRVNKVQNLQDEIAKQKKVIQQRVEEIEEQEKKNKLLNNKLNLLETQLKNFDDVARQEKEELEKGWQKKYKELEKQSVQYKRDLNQLEIQLQQVDLLVQQKEHEVEQAVVKIKELSDLNEKQLQTIQTNSTEILRLNQELEEKDQDLLYAEQQHEEISKERTVLMERIDLQNNEISDLKQQVFQMKKELEGLKWEKQDQDRKIDRLNEQIEQANQSSNQYKQQLDDEIKKTYQLYSEINKWKQDMEDIKVQHQKEIQQQKTIIDGKNDEIRKLNDKLQEFQDQDKDLSDKLKKQMKENENNAKQIQQLQNDKLELEQQKQEQQKLISQFEQQVIEFQQEKQQLLLRIEEIQNDKTEVQLLNVEIEKLKADLDSKKNYDELKEIASQINSVYEEKVSLETQRNELQIQLNKTIEELKERKDKFVNLENEKKKNDNEFAQYKERTEDQQERYLQQIKGFEKKNHQLNEELQKALDKVEILEGALENQSKDIKIIPKQAQVPLHRNNTFQQIFVEDKVFSKDHQNDEIHLKFSEIDFSRSKGHLTICFWVNIDRTNSKEMLPILKISTENKKLLEMGVYLDTKQVYSTFIPNNHPKNTKQQNPLTVTSQLPIKLGEFQLLALILNESGQYMDMGLCLNGVRDDQVSISTSLIFPEAQLSFGKYTTHHLVLKDCLVITENLQRMNIFKEVYQTFYQKYNGVKKMSRRYGQKKENISYLSAGDLIFFLIQQHEQSPPKSGSRSKSPPPTQAVIINNRTIPAGLVNQYELANTQTKTEETKPEEIQEQPQWSRKYSVEKLKKFLYTNFNYKRLLSPFTENYDYISLGLQLLQPPRNDELPPTKFHKIIKPKIQLSPYYMMPYKQFLNYIQFVGLLRVTFEELHDLCELMEVIYTNGKEKYIHYDHFLIVLRECIMTRAELKKKKEQEKGEPQPPQMIESYKYSYKEIIIKSTGIEEQEIELSNAIEITEVSINKNEQLTQLDVKLKNESLQTYPLVHLPGAQVGTLNISQQKKIIFIFSNDSQINEIKTETNSLLLGELSEITLCHELELQENQKIVKFNIQDKQIRVVIQNSKKIIEEIQPLEMDPETELESLNLPQVPDNWNLGKFYVNITRCQNCDKHQSTTRHEEKDFIEKTEYITNLFKELFPNVEIIENEDKIDKLENFEVYIKNALGPEKIMLLQKQESMPKFKDNFNDKLPNLFEKLMRIINFHGTTEKLGQEQEKFK
ncbi:unnamed protein product [Paramecium sonneborni]|uniref:Uncharacterized protein n=1 Tax=Paramecium sonneborni TaxID=65129 RepID=A0A8S1R236_9CILI|nr:unnamed protein product [Paramecium sonneborni]